MVDISKHPLIRQAYELCLAIEKLPASADQTTAISLASSLVQEIDTAVEAFPPMVLRATGRTIPDLTQREHVCEYQSRVTAQEAWEEFRNSGI